MSKVFEFDLWITNAASASYKDLQSIAEAAVSSEQPLPLNRDPRLTARIAAVNHYERTRRILRSLKKSEDVKYDMPLLGIFDHVNYRIELGTCVYFSRLIDHRAVLVYQFSDSPLDRLALRKLVHSGDADVIAKLRLPLPGRNASLMVN